MKLMHCNDNRNDDKQTPISVISPWVLITRRVKEKAPGFKLYYKDKGIERIPMFNLHAPESFFVMGVIADELLCRHLELGFSGDTFKDPVFTLERNHYA